MPDSGSSPGSHHVAYSAKLSRTASASPRCSASTYFRTTRRLRYFIAVASAESFSRAADELHVAQSAVSRQVGLLERELGVRLLRRTTHEVALTDAGRHLLDRGEALARDADVLWEDMRAFAAGERGRVRVGYSTSIG